jgi:putative oxygen-independent coproporphyrinogen III oxidase
VSLGLYVHVPFCATRCGYCDFVTYTAAELPGGGAREAWAATALAELDVARRVAGPRPVDTVFVGGGTPTLLPAEDLGAVLRGIDERFGLVDGAEVTVETNPESVDPAKLEALRAAGVTRLSIGMQHSAPHVLATLERTHTPGRALEVVRWARAAGFDGVSLDVIYGTPGETEDDWRRTLDDVLGAEPDHVSAYALIVEPGTRLAAQVRRGELPAPDDDAVAARYEVACDVLEAGGLAWYEIANWARTPRDRCRHNLRYWTGGDWWGIGPGAHSHLDGTRWWNVKHPSRWAQRVAAGEVPAAGREVLTDAQRHTERLLLESRLADGLDVALLGPAGRRGLEGLVADGLMELHGDRAVPTRRGRLLADTVVLALDQDEDGAASQAIGSASSA